MVRKHFCTELGIIVNYKTRTIIWDGLSVPMSESHRKSDITCIYTISDDPGDRDLSIFMHKAIQRMNKGLNANEYDKHNYTDMINCCDHLD